MHTLKTKRELEIFEQGVKKGNEDMKQKVRNLMNDWDDYELFAQYFNNL